LQGRQGQVFDSHATWSRVIGKPTGRYTTVGSLHCVTMALHDRKKNPRETHD